jgi:hypothetical protein
MDNHYDTYPVGDKDKCESLEVVACGRGDNRVDVLRSRGEPHLSLNCKSITVDGNESVAAMWQALDPGAPGVDGYSITFERGACSKIGREPALLARYRLIAPSIASITVPDLSYPSGSPYPQFDLEISACGLLTLLLDASDSCKQLRIHNCNSTRGVAFVLGFGISKLTKLQSLFLEHKEGEYLEHVFSRIDGGLPHLRHLYLPGLPLTQDYSFFLFRTKRFLLTCPNLVYFDISNSAFGAQGIKMVLDVCEEHKCIQVLVVRDLVGDEECLKDGIRERISTGRMPLLDIVFENRRGNKWRRFKAEMDIFFCLNKEKRERRPLLESLLSPSFDSGRLPYVLSELGNKQEGHGDLFEAFRDKGKLLVHVVVQSRKKPSNYNLKRKHSD